MQTLRPTNLSALLAVALVTVVAMATLSNAAPRHGPAELALAAVSITTSSMLGITTERDASAIDTLQASTTRTIDAVSSMSLYDGNLAETAATLTTSTRPYAPGETSADTTRKLYLRLLLEKEVPVSLTGLRARGLIISTDLPAPLRL